MDNAPRPARAAPAPAPKPRIALGVGHTYRDKTDGTLWTLSGLRARHTVILTGDGASRDHVTLDTLADEYDHVGCDHEKFCCITHRTHTTLHRGCMMR